jgi:hypothetical protein
MPSIYPKVYDRGTDMAIISSTRDMPTDTYHITVISRERVALAFDLDCKYYYDTKTVLYLAPLEKIRSGFNKSRNMLLAFQSDQIIFSRLRDALEFLYSNNPMTVPGWKIQVALV